MPEDQNLEAQQQEDNPERPEWLPDNFNSPEDLAKSYGELRSEFTQTKQQLRAQQEQVEQLLAAKEEEPADDNFIQTSQDQIQAAYEQDPVATMAWLAQQAAEAAYKQHAKANQPDPAIMETQALVAGKYAEEEVTARYSDFDQYREKVAQEITDNPDLYPEDLFKTPASIAKALTRAYKAVKLDTLEADTTSTVEQQIADQRRAKQQAQTLSGATGRPAPQDSWEDRWAEIANAGTRSFRDIVGGT